VIGYVFGPGKLGIFRLFGKVLGVIGSMAARIFNWFDRVSPAVRSITSSVLTLMAKVPGWASKIVSGLTSPFRSLGKKIAGFISAAVGAAVSAITSFGAAVGTALGEAIWNALPDPLKKLLTGGIEGLSKAGGFLSAKAPTKSGRVGGTTPAPGRVNRGAKTRGPAGIIPRRVGGGWTSGLTLVGEQGPELASFPANTYIHPEPKRAILPAINVNSTAHIYWKGREVATAVAEDTSNQKARR